MSAVRVMTSALVWIVRRRRRRRRNDRRVRERRLAFIADDSDQSLKRFFSFFPVKSIGNPLRTLPVSFPFSEHAGPQGVGALSNMCFAREIYPTFLFSLEKEIFYNGFEKYFSIWVWKIYFDAKEMWKMFLGGIIFGKDFRVLNCLLIVLRIVCFLFWRPKNIFKIFTK